MSSGLRHVRSLPRVSRGRIRTDRAALTEFLPSLHRVAEKLGNTKVLNCAVGSRVGVADLNVHPDLVGSSLYLEPEEDETVNGSVRRVELKTVDELAGELELKPPFFFKIDTQGYESEVLRGATHVLQETVGVVLELSLFDFFAGAPPFASVIQQMEVLGFVLYDLFDRRYRPLDGALGQIDALFTPRGGGLRRSHRYANDEQREQQTALIQRSLRRRT